MNTRMITALALTFTLVGTACTDQFGTEPVLEPTVSERRWDPGNQRSYPKSDMESSTGSDAAPGDGDAAWHLVESDLIWPETAASAVIGPEGGSLTLWSASPSSSNAGPAHALKVPPDAVRRATLFVMEVGLDAVIDVHLSATEVSSGRPITEFGEALKLRLTYSGSSVEDPSAMQIVHLVGGNVTESVVTRVDTAHEWVFGEISHFSRYALAFE